MGHVDHRCVVNVISGCCNDGYSREYKETLACQVLREMKELLDHLDLQGPSEYQDQRVTL